MAEDDYEQTWTEFWVPTLRSALIERGVKVDGDEERWSVDTPELWDQIKRELHDWRTAMTEVSKVYDEATGGQLSKATYRAADVIGEINTHYDDCAKDDLIDVLIELPSEVEAKFGHPMRPDGAAADALAAAVEYLMEAYQIHQDDLVDAAKRRDQLRHEHDKRLLAKTAMPTELPTELEGEG